MDKDLIIAIAREMINLVEKVQTLKEPKKAEPGRRFEVVIPDGIACGQCPMSSIKSLERDHFSLGLHCDLLDEWCQPGDNLQGVKVEKCPNYPGRFDEKADR